jgi:hypothetical protein
MARLICFLMLSLPLAARVASQDIAVDDRGELCDGGGAGVGSGRNYRVK